MNDHTSASPSAASPRRINRRAALNLGGLTAAGFAAIAGTPAYAKVPGTGPVGDETRSAAGALAACVDETTLPYQNTINSAALHYEPTSAAASFRFNSTLHSRLKV